MSLTHIPLLNHGFIELVDYMGDEQSILRAARVSYNSDSIATDHAKDEKLIAYLLKNKHTSPFEHVVFTFHVCCPIFVARQWMRHRTASYNEISARYTALPAEFFVPAAETIGRQSSSNKQMRTFDPNLNAGLIQEIIRLQGEAAFTAYNNLLAYDCPRELARSVLPVGTYTRYYFTMNLHNLFHFLELRLHEHAQHEIQVYGQAILKIIKKLAPFTVEYFLKTLPYEPSI